MTSTFSEDLWGSIKLVYDHFEEGRCTLSLYISFFKDLIAIEEKYSSKLQKLCLKTNVLTEKGDDVKESWNGVKKWNEDLSKHHALVITHLQNNVMSPLVQLKKDQENQKALNQKEVSKLEQGLEKGRDALSKAKSKYIKSCKDYEASTLELQRTDVETAKPKDLEKLKLKNMHDKSNAENAHTAYKKSVEEFRAYQITFVESMKKILTSFEDLDEHRLNILKEVLTEFANSQITLNQSHTEEIPVLVASIQRMDSKRETQDFIDKNKSNKLPDPLVVYEPYISTNGIDVPADDIPVEVTENDKSAAESTDTEKDKPKRSKSLKRVKSMKKNKVKNSVDVENGAGKVKTPRKRKETPNGEETKSPRENNESTDVAPHVTEPNLEEQVSTPEEQPIQEEPVDDIIKASEDVVDVPIATISKIAIALYDFEPRDETDIGFRAEEGIIITKEDGEVEDCPGWMEGICNGQIGLFPANHVEILKDFKKCVVQYSFEPQNDDELLLRTGEELVILKELEEWFLGCTIEGRTGLFPSNFVKII